MKIRALKSFSGAISMTKGDIVICNRKEVVDDLVAAGYVEKVEEVAPEQKDISDKEAESGIQDETGQDETGQEEGAEALAPESEKNVATKKSRRK